MLKKGLVTLLLALAFGLGALDLDLGNSRFSLGNHELRGWKLVESVSKACAFPISTGGFPCPSGPTGPPQVQAVVAATRCASAATCSLSVTVGAGSNRALVVLASATNTVGVGAPALSGSQTYGSAVLVKQDEVLGAASSGPCATDPRIDTFTLTAPTVGTANVTVNYASSAVSIFLGAIVLTGVNQVTPIRSFSGPTRNSGNISTAVASANNDLVIDLVTNGTSISSPGAGQTQAWNNEVDASTCANNFASSYEASTGNSVTMSWTANAGDGSFQRGFSVEPSS